MKCIYCGSNDSRVLDSRDTSDAMSIRRRRECLKCGKRWTTYETIETIPMLVIKKNGTRQPYDREKLRHGLIKATEKRPVTLHQIDELILDIERDLVKNLSGEITSTEIGNLTMDKLKGVDEISYIRFASIYKKFESILEFNEFLSKELKKGE